MLSGIEYVEEIIGPQPKAGDQRAHNIVFFGLDKQKQRQSRKQFYDNASGSNVNIFFFAFIEPVNADEIEQQLHPASQEEGQ